MNLPGLVAGLLGFALSAPGADHCSLKVIVTTSEGQVPDVPVVVETTGGRVFATRNRAGGVTVCDLGIRPVKVTVGNDCNRVTITNVVLDWGETRELRVIHDPCAIRDGPPGNACEILMTARVEKGGPLTGAMFAFTAPVPVTYKADLYGRIRTGFGFGKEVRGVVSRDGFAATQFSFRCTVENPTIENEVILRRLQQDGQR